MDQPLSVFENRMPFARWWANEVVSEIDHRAVITTVGEDSGWSAHFAVMTLMSAGIAVLGLLLSSPAVVIGAMLISPLMGPIIGLGFAVAMFDGEQMRRTALALLGGVALAVGFCALIVLFSPIHTVTGEVSSRTRPNLFDLLVALFAGLAGTYAMIRGRHNAIVGVAIATALMPPLAVMGFGLATNNMAVLGGSTLLFFTNLMTIAAAAAVLARLYGFAPDLSPHQTRLQATLIILTMIALAAPLAVSLRQIAWEALATGQARAAIANQFPSGARISQLDIDFHAKPVEVAGTVLTPQYRPNAEGVLRVSLARIMRGEVILSLDQVRTANGAGASADAASSATAAAERSASRLAGRLALVAGVSSSNVLVDRASKRAFVRAAVLPGADMSAYRALESRVAASASGWTIILVPPAAPLPDVRITDGVADRAAIDVAIWAAKRLQLPIGIRAARADDVTLVADSLKKAGVRTAALGGSAPSGRVELQFAAPKPAANSAAVPAANAG